MDRFFFTAILIFAATSALVAVSYVLESRFDTEVWDSNWWKTLRPDLEGPSPSLRTGTTRVSAFHPYTDTLIDGQANSFYNLTISDNQEAIENRISW